MFKLGNTFGGLRTKKEKEPEISPAGSTATLQGAQMAAGRANKALEVKNAELADARAKLAELDRTIGEKSADGEDASVEVLAMREAESLVRQCESAVAVLLQRQQAAEVALTDAIRAQSEAAKDAAKDHLCELIEEGEKLLIHQKLFREDLVSRLSAARRAGGIESWAEREILDHYDFFVKIANRSSAADAADSGAFRKYPRWTVCVQYGCGRVSP